MDNQEQPKNFLRIIESPDGKLKKGSFVPVEFTKDGKLRITGEAIEVPKEKIKD